jgi:uroporphyrinogen-III synthase
MMENSASNTGYQGPALAGRSRMTEELSGRRIVVPETRELDQLVRLLEERGAEAIPCPMIAIRDAPDAEPIAAWLRRFADGRCDDLVLMTGEGLRRLLGFARRTDLESAFLDALRTTRKITRGPKPVRALRAVGLDADIRADEPTTEGIIAAMRRLDLSGRSVGVQLNPGNPNPRLMYFIVTAGAVPDPVLPYVYASEVDDARVIAVMDDMAAGRVDAICLHKRAPGSPIPRSRPHLRPRSGTGSGLPACNRCGSWPGRCGRA